MSTPRFQVIIRYAGTTGPEGIHAGFYAKDKLEGRVRLQEELSMLLFPQNMQVQIFDLHAA
jgi:hypothetical protein